MDESKRFILGEADLTIESHEVGPVSQHQIAVAGRLVTITRTNGRWKLQRRHRMSGYARFGSAIVTVPPRIPTRTFLGLVYLFHGIPLEDIGAIDVDNDEYASELFRSALAMGLTRAADEVSRTHVAQTYEVHQERLQILRGRPLWKRELNRVRDGSIECEFVLKTTDNLLNRLLLAGLGEARRCLTAGGFPSMFRRQLAVWERLATPKATIERHDFLIANDRLTRQTQAYGPALRLCETLLLGTGSPNDTFKGHIALPIYDIAPMFEKLVQELAVAIATYCGRNAETQKTLKQVLRDGKGNYYRSFRPDAVINSGVQPTAVFDAKYKPQYMRLDPLKRNGHRVERGDVFQLFLYANLLGQEYGRPVPAYIVAPLLGDDSVMPPLEERRVILEDEVTRREYEMRVIPIPVVRIIDSLLEGQSRLEAAAHADELIEAVCS